MSANGVSTPEDSEMAECDGEKVVTMMDVLQEQQEFEEDANAVLGASDEKDCTYPKGYIKRQAIYACMTCCSDVKTDPDKRAGVCLACSLNCHENHELIELYTKRNFRCDCGNPHFNSNSCTFNPNKKEFNKDNKYNQNYSGLYCICQRPYPDPDSTIEDEMIQCIICEDWLHASHLDAVVPCNEQYSEMICKGCMEKNEFLHDYSSLTVNTENAEIDVISSNDVSMSNGNTNSAACLGKEDKNSSTLESNTLSVNCDKDVEIKDKTKTTNSSNETNEQTDKNSSALNNETRQEISETLEDIKEEHDLNKSEKKTNEYSNSNATQEVSECEKQNVLNPETEKDGQQTDDKETNENKDHGDNLKTIEETSNDNEKKNTKEELFDNEHSSSLKEDIQTDVTSSEITGKIKNASNESAKIENSDSGDSTNTDIQDKGLEMSELNKDNIETTRVLEATEDNSGDTPDLSNESEQNIKIIDVRQVSMEKEEATVDNVNDNKSKADKENRVPEEYDSSTSRDSKRKLSTEENKDVTVKKAKIDENSCIRPKGVKRYHKGATFWTSNFRQKLCTCCECLTMYKDLGVLFLVDPEDTVNAYETLGKERTDGSSSSQYEKGLQALSSLDRVQQINALTEYNKMRDKLLDFLKSFKDRKEIVKEEDIKAFFAGMKPKREPDGVYFCR
ncbi:putative E3 ubiquitin-protein ligase UBR7 [Battus philenor]|uniref:putative E3 ubiquitin-protein ligase UBR7 n=1 Tax=Battus philenor TaxID=42288 RepID=UPI0035D0F85D